jgi:thiol:disulfide interchange protein DsbD
MFTPKPGSAASPSIASRQQEPGSLTSKLEKSGLLLSLIIVFFGGLALNLTPCVYPLIPITIGYFGGQSEGRTSRLFMLGLLYVLGMSITYSVIGVVTSLSGAVFGTLMQNSYVILIIAALFVILSLSMFGVYEFKLPDSLVMKAGNAQSGYYGAFFMGLTMGIVAAPCIGPFVLGLVTYVAAKADPLFGFIMFFTLAMGLGLPYLLLALFSGKIKKLPRAGEWMEAVKHIFGFMLLGMAIYFAGPVLPKLLGKYLLPAFMFFSAFWLLVFDRLGTKVTSFRIFKIAFCAILMALAVYMVYPNNTSKPEWSKYENSAFTQASASGHPVIVDFYADWCIPCKEFEASTFSDKNVISEMKRFENFKVDMTKSGSPETEALRNKYNIIGVPTIIIFDSNGQEALRLTGFVNAEKFSGILKTVK